MKTWFAPAERDSNEEWSRQAQTLSENSLIQVLMDSVEGHLVVLNSSRQVVAGNEEFLALLGHPGLTPGKRLGELLGCENSELMQGGCGTSLGCRNCGAVLAMLEALDRRTTVTGECHLTTLVDGRRQSQEFRVKATPLDIGGALFLAFVFQDISSEKRRQVLEQVFFHDIGNLLGGIHGYSELVSLQTGGDMAAQNLVRISRLLKGEIEAHRWLSRAESGDFAVQYQPVMIETVLQDVWDVFREHPVATGRQWSASAAGPGFLQTERTVLVRILVNMVKNAFEATPPGEEVRLTVEPWDSGLRFTVHNPGVMDPEVIPRVFERTFSTKNQPGRGLGTYAMRLLAEGFLGGKVTFRSEALEGTRFFLDLPVSP